MEKNILESFAERQDVQPIYTSDFELYSVHSSQGLQSNEKFMEAPRRIRTDKGFSDIRGFVEYCRDFAQENSVIFADSEKAICHFDYHTNEQPAWDEHKASLKLTKSTGWKLWNQKNNEWMEQEDFADFLDRGVVDVVQPTQADLLQLFKNFRITAKMELDSNVSAAGSTLNFREEVRGGTNIDSIDLPESIVVRLLPYEGADRINNYINEDEDKIVMFDMTARIYWRMSRRGDKARPEFRYSLLNLDKAEDETLESIRAAIRCATEVKTYIA